MLSIRSVLNRQPLLCWSFLQWLRNGGDPQTYGEASGLIRAYLTLNSIDKSQIEAEASRRYDDPVAAAIDAIDSEILESWYNPFEDYHTWFRRGCPQDGSPPVRSLPTKWIAFVMVLSESERERVAEGIAEAYTGIDQCYDGMSAAAALPRNWRDEIPDDLGYFETEEEYHDYLDDNAPWNK